MKDEDPNSQASVIRTVRNANGKILTKALQRYCDYRHLYTF